MYVRFNSSDPVEVEVEEGTSVSELKETVGRLRGVQPDQLRVIFAGRELCGDSTLQVDVHFSLSVHLLFVMHSFLHDWHTVDTVCLNIRVKLSVPIFLYSQDSLYITCW